VGNQYATLNGAARRSLPVVWRWLTQRPGNTKKRRLLATLDAISKTAHTVHGVHEAIVTITNAIETIGGEREMGSVWSTMIRPLMLY
jgi:hypothetical protein